MPDSDALLEATRALLDLRAEIVVQIMRSNDRPAPEGEGPPLSAPQHLTLSVLVDGPMSVGEIADRTGVSASTATRMLQGLARHGMIDDAEAPDADRRRRYVTLTQSGRDAVDARSRQLMARFAHIIGDLDADDIEALLRGVRIFDGALKRNAALRGRTADQASASRSSSEKGAMTASTPSMRSTR